MSVWILIMYLSANSRSGGPMKIEVPTKEECLRVDAAIRKTMDYYVDKSTCVEVKK